MLIWSVGTRRGESFTLNFIYFQFFNEVQPPLSVSHQFPRLIQNLTLGLRRIAIERKKEAPVPGPGPILNPSQGDRSLTATGTLG